MKLLIYSKALYSTWIYYSPDNILFDAGEAVSSIMGNKSFAVERVFLSHGHTDHIAGLVGLVNIRNNAMGDKAKPLTIYYPKNNFHISELINYLHRTNNNLSYPLEWVPLESGDKVDVFRSPNSRNYRYLQAFSTDHSKTEVSLGYNIVEVRQRLKAKYRNLTEETIAKKAEQGDREDLMESYDQKIFTYGGDSVPLNPKDIEETEILCHDSTFLREEDRKEYKHATLEEAIEVARRAKVQRELIAFHISSRYKNEVQKFETKVREEEDLDCEVTLIQPGRIFSRE